MPINEQGEQHGYWEVNFHSGGGYACYYINGVPYGLDDIDWGDEDKEKVYYAR